MDVMKNNGHDITTTNNYNNDDDDNCLNPQSQVNKRMEHGQ